MATTPLAEFVTSLWETGQVHVPELPASGAVEFTAADLAESELRLLTFASEQTPALPGIPPPVENQAAMWGLKALFTLCSLIVHRKLTTTPFESLWDDRRFAPVTPQIVYSVDLSLRYLPDLHRLASTLSDNDPLCDVLEHLGRRWPLSSVGMQLRSESKPSETPIDDPLAGWWHDDCLRRLYLDRITDREAVERLRDPRVKEAMRSVIGFHEELSPAIAAALRDDRSSPANTPAENVTAVN